MNKRIKKKVLTKQQQYIYGAIGFILHISSLIEYNLIQLIAAEKYLSVFDKDNISFDDIELARNESNGELHSLSNSKKMMGKLIGKLESTNVFEVGFIEDLRKASNIRGYYAHQFYKDDLCSRLLEKHPLKYKRKINEDVGFLYQLNSVLVEMDKDNRRLVKLVKDKVYKYGWKY